VNLLADMTFRLSVTSQDKLFSVTSMSFDIFQLELWVPLLSGATLYLARQEIISNPEELINEIFDEQPSIMQATPTLWNMIADTMVNQIYIKNTLVGGESLNCMLRDKLLQFSEHSYNVYGPTETTVWSTCAKLNFSEKITIGKPIANTTCYILDDHLQMVPFGHIGQLYIGGEGVSSGYHHKEEENNQRFIQNPYVHTQKDIIYQTGDLVAYNEEGSIEYKGRIDDQIKFRGYRIELEEISTALLLHTAVKNAIALYTTEINNIGKISIYLILKTTEQSLDLEEVRQYLSQSLPDYMLPNAIVVLDQYPTLPNGKIDKKALQKFSLGTIEVKEYIAPRTELEKHLAEIWQKYLSIKKISVDARFFNLGGHSLLIPELVSEINVQLYTALTIRNFVENITIAKLATFITQHFKGYQTSTLLEYQHA
jgi:acyl-coenzyme A synthetase/AMP-(fatty) acid ligase